MKLDENYQTITQTPRPAPPRKEVAPEYEVISEKDEYLNQLESVRMEKLYYKLEANDSEHCIEDCQETETEEAK